MFMCVYVCASLDSSSELADRFSQWRRRYIKLGSPGRLLLAGFFFRLLFDPQGIPPKRRWTCTRLYGVTFQKMVLFIVTAVRTRNPTENNSSIIIIIIIIDLLVYKSAK
jgi:hypothetical protein